MLWSKAVPKYARTVYIFQENATNDQRRDYGFILPELAPNLPLFGPFLGGLYDRRDTNASLASCAVQRKQRATLRERQRACLEEEVEDDGEGHGQAGHQGGGDGQPGVPQPVRMAADPECDDHTELDHLPQGLVGVWVKVRVVGIA